MHSESEEFIDESERESSMCGKKKEDLFGKYMQEIYELRRKLEASEVVKNALEEEHESQQQISNQRIAKVESKLQEAEERHRIAKEEYEDRLAELEKKLTEKTAENQELRNRLEEKDKKLALETLNRITVNSQEDSLATATQRIEELVVQLHEEESNRKILEELLERAKNDCREREEILQTMRSELKETNHVLEKTREELALSRAELLAAKASDVDARDKGNSLFAEVEDRRKVTMQKMKALKDRYEQAKRLCDSRTAEVKALRAEKAAMLEKWKEETYNAMEQNDELLKSCKNRIRELEEEIKYKKESENLISTLELEKFSDSQQYAFSVFNAQKKEIQELRVKLEKYSMRDLIREETKCTLAKKLRYWRYKAKIVECRLLEMESFLAGMEDPPTELQEILRKCTADFNLVELPKTLEEANVDVSNNDERSASGAEVKSWTVKSDIAQQKETTVTEESKPAKSVRFSPDTITQSNCKEKLAPVKSQSYSVVFISKENTKYQSTE